MPQQRRQPPELISELDKYELITRVAGSRSISELVHDDGLPRIYGKKDLSLWAVVDPDDFAYFSRWCWSYARSPWGKLYICRRANFGSHYKQIDGQRFYIPGRQRTLYLHREIVLRLGRKPPSSEHKLVDHRNGNSLDCRRKNLRWSTYSENNTDQHGRRCVE